MLCDLQEMTYADAAAASGCAVGTVRSRLHRGRALLAVKHHCQCANCRRSRNRPPRRVRRRLEHQQDAQEREEPRMKCHSLRDAIVELAREGIAGPGTRAAVESHVEHCRIPCRPPGSGASVEPGASGAGGGNVVRRIVGRARAAAAGGSVRRAAVCPGGRQGSRGAGPEHSGWRPMAQCGSRGLDGGGSDGLVGERAQWASVGEARPVDRRARGCSDAEAGTRSSRGADAGHGQAAPPVAAGRPRAARARRAPASPVVRPVGFVALPGAAGLPDFESGQIIRMEIPLASLPTYGIEIQPDAQGTPVAGRPARRTGRAGESDSAGE